MKKGRKRFLTVLAVCILIIASHPIWLPLPAKFLVVKDNIRKADAIAVLSGGRNFYREAKAVELYKKGLGGKMIRILEQKDPDFFNILNTILNLELTQKKLYSRYFESSGIPQGALILGGAVATSTFDELTAVKGILLKDNFKSVILVTSDYHMRRALMTARWLFRSEKVDIYNTTAYSGDFHPARWWLYEDDIKSVTMEYLSILFYLTYHFALGK